MPQLFKNNAFSTLGASMTNVATTLTVATGLGDRFPVVSAPDFMLLTLQDASNNIEIVKVTTRTTGSDSMTIQRAQEGTTARAWNLGDVVELRLTAGALNPLSLLEGAATAAAIRTAIGALPSGEAATLTVNSSSDALKITQTGSGNALYIEDVAADATPFVVSSTGVVGIGTTTPDNVTSAGIALVSNDGFMPQLVNRNKAADTSAGYQVFDKDRNGSIVQNGDVLGNIVFRGYDGATYHQAAAIMASVDGAPGTNDMPGALRFLTTADGASAPTERMRIDASGNLGVGGTPSQALHVARGAGVSAFSTFRANGAAAGALYGQDSSNAAYCWNESNAPLYFGTNNTVRATLDSSGNLLMNSAALGYGAGAGGTVTQATSKSTAVTLNKPSGRITMHNAALASGAQIEFALQNTFIAANDTVLVHPSDPANVGYFYDVMAYNVMAGSCFILVRNTSGSSRPDPLQLSFTVMKGSNT
jgi:hypothetical protein